MVQSNFEDKTILITGGSGSIGSYLVEKLVDLNCKSIRILSNNEHELYELEKRYEKNDKLRYLIGDIRDRKRLEVATDGTDIVFHAAALKHVPICEYNPLDAVQTNVIGTQNVIEACAQSKVKKFIFISTDKAAGPLSTLGATKLLAERLTISSGIYRSSIDPISYCVRFGNVFGSRGSVVELFMQQIKEKKEITITDEKMTRFFMSHQDAANLILSTVDRAKGNEIFVLKMKVMKIYDLAKAMIEIYGSNQDISIVKTGIRQGEKLHEELITHDESTRVREIDDMYVIPNFNSHDYDSYPRLKTAYSSNNVTPMTIDEIKDYLKNTLSSINF